MINETKSFASLGPTLLARKGGARPAMRPQLSPLLGAHALNPDLDQLEDLGWNDMGDVEDETHGAEIVPIGLSPMGADAAAEAAFDDESEEAEASAVWSDYAPVTPPIAMAEFPPEPQVRRQQQALSASVRSELPQRRSAADHGRRAAFTLRLDAQRHLKLRLASTVRNCSAQQLVTQALDQFLANIPELETLAAHVNRD